MLTEKDKFKQLAPTAYLIFILWLGCQLAGAQSEQLLGFQCEITVFDQHHVGVRARAEGNLRASSSPIKVTLVRYPGQTIVDLKAMDEHRNQLPFDSAVEQGAVVLHVRMPSDVYSSANSVFIFTLEYTVAVQRGEIKRIPLPVPEARPFLAGRNGEIVVTLPEGDVAIGDTFPTFTWSDATHASAQVEAVPSVVIIYSKPAASVTVMNKLFTMTVLSDIAMFTLVIVGSSFWWFRKRPNADEG